MLSLDEIRIFCGTPLVVDGISLDEEQANFLARTTKILIDDAGHREEVARELAERAFRSSYEKTQFGWSRISEMRLPGVSRVIKHRFGGERE